MKTLLKMCPFALAISLLTILIVYTLFNDVIEYWKLKGKIIALSCGVVAIIGTFLFKFIQSQLGKTNELRVKECK